MNTAPCAPEPVWPLPHDPELGAQLRAAYADPARGYHNLTHLREVLQRLAELAEVGEPFDELPLLLAAWFHDAIYDGAPDAEERSAQWAERALPAAGVDPETTSEVTRLVRLTQQHAPAPGDRNGAALCDADMAVLAAGPERYRDYLRGVRRDYRHYDDVTFAVGRRAVLADLSDRRWIFHTPTGKARWEGPARANLADEAAGRWADCWQIAATGVGATSADDPPPPHRPGS